MKWLYPGRPSLRTREREIGRAAADEGVGLVPALAVVRIVGKAVPARGHVLRVQLSVHMENGAKNKSQSQ